MNALNVSGIALNNERDGARDSAIEEFGGARNEGGELGSEGLHTQASSIRPTVFVRPLTHHPREWRAEKINPLNIFRSKGSPC